MTVLEQLNASYVILSSPKLDDMISILYAKDYQVIPIKSYYKENYENAAISFGRVDNNSLRNDVLLALNYSDENSAIIKYAGESQIKRIFKDGSENLMEVIMYNTDSNKISYIHNGISFSFTESVRYWKPKIKDDFKVGMMIEYFSNNSWCEKRVENPIDEYEKLYKLLIKYDKVRVPQTKP